MAKEVVKLIKLQIKAGAANPSPPVGPALGQAGVNIMAFCKEFNANTQAQAGDVLPVVISVYKDKSFSFITKKPPAGNLLKKIAGLASGSKEANKIKVGKITKAQLMEVVKIKMPDLNTKDPEAACRITGLPAPAGGKRIPQFPTELQPLPKWPNTAANATKRQSLLSNPARTTR